MRLTSFSAKTGGFWQLSETCMVYNCSVLFVVVLTMVIDTMKEETTSKVLEGEY